VILRTTIHHHHHFSITMADWTQQLAETEAQLNEQPSAFAAAAIPTSKTIDDNPAANAYSSCSSALPTGASEPAMALPSWRRCLQCQREIPNAQLNEIAQHWNKTEQNQQFTEQPTIAESKQSPQPTKS